MPLRLAERDTEAMLAELGSCCGSVVICRASPSQKAAIVHMMNEFELRRAGGRTRGFLGWWRRSQYGLKVRGPHFIELHAHALLFDILDALF